MRFLLLLTLLVFFVGCKHLPEPDPEEQGIQVRISDESGKPVSEAAGGSILKIHSEYFAALMQRDQNFVKEAKIIIDQQEIDLLDAKGDFITFSLPYLSHEVRSLILFFKYRDLLLRLLCSGRPCILYIPTVSGRVFSGMSDGVVDGTFQMPAEMTTDAAGNLYVIDQRDLNDVIIKVNPAGIPITFAGAGGEFGRLVGIDVDDERNRLYVTDATSQQVKYINLTSPGAVAILAGSGTAGNTNGSGMAASFHFGTQRVDNFSINEQGQGLAVHPDGSIYVGEIYNPTTQASQLRQVTPAGVVSNVPGSRTNPMDLEEVLFPAGLACGPATDIYYVGGASSMFQGVVRVSSGTLSKLAGRVNPEELNDGTGSVAKFSFPKAIDYVNGYLYIADGTNGALRRATLSGEVVTLAGASHFDTPTWCLCGPEVPAGGSYFMPTPAQVAANPDAYEERAAAIKMDQVGGVAAKNNGIIYVSDYGYKVIWEIRLR